jgi:hypothetical protein
MEQQDRLATVLSEFARTLTTDFPIQGILDHLVRRIVDVLPVSGAGVTLISDGLAPQFVAASDPSALRYERLQSEIGEGPCLAAYSTGGSVSVPDLARDLRFPRFGPMAVAAGLAAVWTFPLRHEAERLGALDLYRDSTGALDAADMAAAQTLADVTAAYLLNARAREDAPPRPRDTSTGRCTTRSPGSRTGRCWSSGWSTPPSAPGGRTPWPRCSSPTSTASSSSTTPTATTPGTGSCSPSPSG